MILFLRDDLILETFDSTDSPPNHIEWIDVKNGEYSFCDHKGQRYQGEFIRHGDFFRPERWKLVPVGQLNPNNALQLLNRAVAIDPDYSDFTDLKSLRAFLQE
jgi:hypothetical protein